MDADHGSPKDPPPTPLAAWRLALDEMDESVWNRPPDKTWCWHPDPSIAEAIQRAVDVVGGVGMISTAGGPAGLGYFRDGFCEAYQAELQARGLVPTAAEPIPEIMDRTQAAAFLGVSPSWLTRHTPDRGGPPMAKAGRAVHYLRTSLVAWLAGREEREPIPEPERPRITARPRPRLVSTPDPLDSPASELAARLARGTRKAR